MGRNILHSSACLSMRPDNAKKYIQANNHLPETAYSTPHFNLKSAISAALLEHFLCSAETLLAQTWRQ